MPNIAVIGRDHNGRTLRDQWVSDEKSDENHLNKQMKNSEFLDSEKLSLIAVVLDNISLYHRHNRNLERYMEPLCGGAAKKVDPKDIRGYEPVQPLENTYNGISLVPLGTYHFDLDVIQRLHHGTTVIHLEPYLGRSTSCFLQLDASCGTISWHKLVYTPIKEFKEKEASKISKSCTSLVQGAQSIETIRAAACSSPRPLGTSTTLDEEFVLVLSR
ncbi:hypothetical protein AB6A40_009961 [Gnathostoma spinigerum]|uniref:Uncharacterized protein n=1 Tax=Gnathostoma spinigerum TaxID=75299 RepID=A0ABD6F1K6_9BILA